MNRGLRMRIAMNRTMNVLVCLKNKKNEKVNKNSNTICH
jgi:hypothetical protein